MIFKQLSEIDASEFRELILDMYGHLDNLEWFSPMPNDLEEVKSIINNPRFFVLGAYENDTLCAVSSFDFKCGKLVGKGILPDECTLDNTVEIAFTMVKATYKGKGIMKEMIKVLEEKVKELGFKYVFGKVHEDNLASYKSFLRCGYNKYCVYDKELEKDEFASFIESGILNQNTINKAKESLLKDPLIVKYGIYMKEM